MTTVIKQVGDVGTSPSVDRAAAEYSLGALRRSFLLLTRIRMLGEPRDEDKVFVYEYEHGLLRQDAALEPVVFRWADIATVTRSETEHYTNRTYKHTTFEFVLTRRDGLLHTMEGRFKDPAKGPSLTGSLWEREHLYARLGEDIARYVAAALLPGASARLAAGEELAFGPLALGERGLRTIRGELVPWAQIARIQVHEGTFSAVRTDSKRPFESCRVNRIPNFVLFVTLARNLRSAHGR